MTSACPQPSRPSRGEVGVAVAQPGECRRLEARQGGGRIAGEQCLQPGRQVDIARLNRTTRRPLDEVLRAREPAVSRRQLAAQDEHAAEPERTAHGGDAVVVTQVLTMSARPRITSLVVVAGEVGGDRHAFDIDGVKGRNRLGGAQLLICLAPRPALEQTAGTVQHVIRRHRFLMIVPDRHAVHYVLSLLIGVSVRIGQMM